MMRLYTAGYQGIDIGRFLKALSALNIQYVIDVRKESYSRKKDFSKSSLNAILSEHGINYLDLSELGTPKELRNGLKNSGNFAVFQTEYLKILKTKLSELKKIINLVNDEHNVVLLCFEKDHQQCHRTLIAEEIKRINGNGLEIKPILF
jgi:uncharacterized protein (DUF488 family)